MPETDTEWILDEGFMQLKDGSMKTLKEHDLLFPVATGMFMVHPIDVEYPSEGAMVNCNTGLETMFREFKDMEVQHRDIPVPYLGLVGEWAIRKMVNRVRTPRFLMNNVVRNSLEEKLLRSEYIVEPFYSRSDTLDFLTFPYNHSLEVSAQYNPEKGYGLYEEGSPMGIYLKDFLEPEYDNSLYCPASILYGKSY